MHIIKTISDKILFIIQLILVMAFILFEELIWDVFARPVYRYICSLKISEKIKTKVSHSNRYLVLVIFIVLFGAVEAAGMYAGVLALNGHVSSAILLYMTKIPIAAFTFWLFEAAKSKLLSFGWFDWAYHKITALFERIKQTSIYRQAKEILAITRSKIAHFKRELLSNESSMSVKIKKLYRYLKSEFRK